MAKKSDGDPADTDSRSADPNRSADEARPAGVAAAETPAPPMGTEDLRKLASLRAHVRQSFGQAVLAMMMLPRYRRQSLENLRHVVLEPLLNDRVAIAYAEDAQGPGAELVGLAVWASVSEEVDVRIRDQIRAGTFPVRLNGEDWNSGPVNWLLDVIALDPRSTARVIANFKQVAKKGSLRLHPLVARLVDEDMLKRMGAERLEDSGPAAAPADATAD